MQLAPASKNYVSQLGAGSEKFYNNITQGWVADKIRVCAGSQVVGSPNLDEFLWSL